jgi:hypothetical protein
MSSWNLSDCHDLEHVQFLKALQMMIWDVEQRIPGSENTQRCALQDHERLRTEFTQIEFHQIRIRKGIGCGPSIFTDL